MSSLRLQQRVPSARFVAIASLKEHQLRFHKRGKDESGKCDCYWTNDPSHTVHGVAFEILRTEKMILDAVEGLGRGYEQKQVELITADRDILSAYAYYATDIDTQLLPFEWYLEHVVRGAREHVLPENHVNFIESVSSVSDHDRERHQRELSIYL